MSDDPIRTEQSGTKGGRLTVRLSNVVNDAVNKTNKEKMQRIRGGSTLAKLKILDLQLHGREDDMEMLKGKLRGLEKLENEMIMVVGNSGCGKSSLVTRGIRYPAKKMGIAFCGGKFDQNKINALPYSAVAEALSKLAQHALDSRHASSIMSAMKKALGEEDMRLVGKAMPGCQKLFLLCSPRRNSLQLRDRDISMQSFRSYESNAQTQRGFGKEAVNRLQYAIKRLMKAICSHLRVVVFIDDLQWADGASLELIFFLQTDKALKSLLLVGAYRENEVLDDHPLMFRIRAAEKIGSLITTIRLRNLELKPVQSLVAEVLRMEDREDSINGLASIVQRKTDGNPFFVIMFLTSVYEEELLQFNLGAMRWNWSEEAIKQKFATDNVTSLVISKLKRFDPGAQNSAKVASCLGTSFSITLVKTIVDEMFTEHPSQETGESFTFIDYDDDNGGSTFDIDDTVVEFEYEGIWERETDDVYRFGHDQVQSAAFELIPKDEQEHTMGNIGGILLKKLDDDAIYDSLFVIVSLRNHASSSLNEDERLALAKLNVKAGLKASENAAFDAAVVYFQAAREILGPTGWQVDQDLSLCLYSAEAQARFAIGDLKLTGQLIEDLLSKDVPIEDKFLAYVTKLTAASSGNRLQEAVDTAFEVLKLLGFKKFPSKPSKIKIIRDYIKTNRALKGLSKEDIVALPDLDNERVAMGQKTMQMVCVPAFQTNPNLFPLIIFRMIRITIKSGISVNSCSAFSGFGTLLCGAFGDLARARRMGEIVELLLKKPGYSSMISRQTVTLQAFIYHWTAPLQATLSPFLKGYQAGLESGDIESACFNLVRRNYHLWFCSCPLDDVLNQLKVSRDVFNKLSYELGKASLPILLQTVINLQGDSPTPWELSGEEMEFGKMEAFCIKTKNYTFRAGLILAQLELFVIFQYWVPARQLLMRVGDLRPFMKGLFASVRYTFVEGLICLKAAQAATSRLERRKMRAKAKKSLKIMQGWWKKGNVNVVHTVHLLSAEFARLDGNRNQAEENFKAASVAARRSGYLADKALAHELAGMYYMDQNDSYWAKYNWEEAYKTYLDWKATAKAADLARKYPQFIILDVASDTFNAPEPDLGQRPQKHNWGQISLILEE